MVAVTEDDQPYRGAERRNGPTLGEYLETRLKLKSEHLDATLAAMDLRYQQRFEAQSDALAAAFLSQQTAMQTALMAAKEAVQAALAGQVLATSKAESEANQRSIGVVGKIDEVARRIDALASRFDTLAGQLAGGSGAGKSFEGRIALAFSSIAVMILLWRAFSGN